ncbi:MAG: galactose-6-phosphate isomerase subunit LacA [Megasphaera sp.]|jgi:galactose-6-phosphate isomerase|nr:galactose-6-phosphate isomerase subunit LacA [Megasphaera sp.]
MKIAIGSDQAGYALKETIKQYLEERGYDVLDVTPKAAEDFVESSLAVTRSVLNHETDRGIMFDEYGVGSHMASSKLRGAITANVTDENSAHMTRRHNATMAIAIGAGIVGLDLAKRLVDEFLSADYDGGRHQVRVDMMNKLL